MLKTLPNKILEKVGFRLIKLPHRDRNSLVTQSVLGQGQADLFIHKISLDPLNAEYHLQYSKCAFKNGDPYLAFAELKTAEFLGADSVQAKELSANIIKTMPVPEAMDNNRYSRFMTLASEIKDSKGADDVSVLDVGGGSGALATFIPECSYCLADPMYNGISGTKLPFPERSFDYVVSCHVLEHIPPKSREEFLDRLLSRAKRGVILLNPFFLENTCTEERLKLFIDVTGSPWAKEHLECSLPRLEDVKEYALQKGLAFRAEPKGSLMLSMALVFMDHFAAVGRFNNEWARINSFINKKYLNIIDTPEYPTAYLIHLGRPGG